MVGFVAFVLVLGLGFDYVYLSAAERRMAGRSTRDPPANVEADRGSAREGVSIRDCARAFS
jgi:hypothetical protein